MNPRTVRRLVVMAMLVPAVVLGRGESAVVSDSGGQTSRAQAMPFGTNGSSLRPPVGVTVATSEAAVKSVAERAWSERLALRTSASRRHLGELVRARRILAGYVAKYPILAGTTVEFGDARGYQAISYYQSARIVISPTHTASLERLIGHEIWHIIDWRDNGRIDWGENVPPQ